MVNLLMKKTISIIIVLTLLCSFAGCNSNTQTDMIAELGLYTESKDATEYTIEVNSSIYSTLDFSDKTEYEFATRGLIDAPEALEIKK